MPKKIIALCICAFTFASERYHLITSADFLYWTAREEGLAYAQAGVLPLSPGVDVPKRRDTTLAQGSWDVGFRAALGLQLEHEAWDALFQYTRFTTSDSGAIEGELAPTWSLAGLTGIGSGTINTGLQVGHASADWHLTYNTLTLSLSKTFGHFTPFIGMAATFQKQSYNITYSNFGNLNTFTELSSAMANNNWGIGMRGGIDSAWMFTPLWGFYSHCGLAALWTRFQATRKDTAVPTSTPVHNVSDFHTVKPYLDISLGLRFDYTSDRLDLVGKIGWEAQVWWSENQFTRLFTAGGGHGDLTLQGLTAQICLHY